MSQWAERNKWIDELKKYKMDENMERKLYEEMEVSKLKKLLNERAMPDISPKVVSEEDELKKVIDQVANDCKKMNR